MRLHCDSIKHDLWAALIALFVIFPIFFVLIYSNNENYNKILKFLDNYFIRKQ